MRESLSCNVTLRRFGAWRVAVAVVAVAAIATMAAWGASAVRMDSASTATMVATAAVLALGSAWLAVSLGRVEGGVLACSDGRWTFTGDRGAASGEAGELAVALDLGSFLLLTLTRGGGHGPVPRRRWLPVQRRGLEADWHALRCAVYSPPPVAPQALAADKPPH